MTVFEKAFANTCKHEGGHVNDPDDPGGETYMGISHRWHPDWRGWILIRELVDAGQALGLSKGLSAAVQQFYRVEYWHRVAGDEVAELSVEVAIELFDTAVNLSPADAVRYLQEGLNLVNVGETLWPDIVVDGRVGRYTLSALQRCCWPGSAMWRTNSMLLLKVMNTLQGGHYIDQMRRYPAREKFRGWFVRV